MWTAPAQEGHVADPSEAITAVGETLFGLVAQVEDTFMPKARVRCVRNVREFCVLLWLPLRRLGQPRGLREPCATE